MSRFLQLHLLTFHGPNNINRDDLGRPKTAMIGGAERLRISSQAIKRAIRTSETFEAAMKGHVSARTQRLGDAILKTLTDEGTPPDAALAAAKAVAKHFGALKDEKGDQPTQIEQLAFVSPTERERALAFARRLVAGETIDEKKETPLLKADTAVDIAMFGRMLADAPAFNREAAVQVAHAFTTHKAAVEADYYTAMDDNKPKDKDVGAGFIGSTGFGSGVYYTYVNVNTALLTENLAGDRDLAGRAVQAFVRSLATVTPSGKINSFANHGRPSYILAEAGDQAPRTLSGAFLKPVREREGEDLMAVSIEALERHRLAMDRAYGPCADHDKVVNVEAGIGTLEDIIGFAGAILSHA